MDDFTRAFFECALWSSNDDGTPEGGESLDENYTIDDIDPKCRASLEAECKRFQEENAADIATGVGGRDSNGPFTREARAGHDFWLTRNRHGAGFWDGDWPEAGERLTAASQAFPEVTLYVGDNGVIYACGYEALS